MIVLTRSLDVSITCSDVLFIIRSDIIIIGYIKDRSESVLENHHSGINLYKFILDTANRRGSVV